MTPSAAAMESWELAWNPSAGLWRQEGPGHTAAVAQLDQVHPIPPAASRLLLAAEAKLLNRVQVSKVLGAIAAAQVTDEGPNHGCFRWYLEESQPTDTNAAFFAGLSLIALRLGHAAELSPVDQQTLGGILCNLLLWFQRAVAQPTPYYPNKYLGDLVCCWLLMEINEVEDDGTLRRAMIDAAHYWNRHHWGWGEHLSDTYSGVLLDELSLLLLMAKRLPPEVRFSYQQLFDKLLVMEDQFDGPRVPAVRSYAFTSSPKHRNYRETVLPLGATPASEMNSPPTMAKQNELLQFSNRPPLGSVFASRKWHETAIVRHSRGHDLRLPCFGEATAAARIEKDARLGTLSHFPLMSGADHSAWGLSWQSFPVALWKPEGDWGFLQWETRVGHRVRAHPAEDKRSAYLDNGLTQTVHPPLIGRTYCIQQGGDALILRLMPQTTSEWDTLHDRFRLIDSHAEIVDLPPIPTLAPLHWQQRLLAYATRTISVQCLPLFEGASAESFKRETFDGRRALDWDLALDRPRMAGLRCVPILWGLSLNGPIKTPPRLTIVPDRTAAPRNAEERIVQIHWEWGTARWDILIDPLAATPLKEI